MNKMEFGIGMFGDLTYDFEEGKFQSAQQRLNEMVEQVQLADQLSIGSFVLGEHHRSDYAVSSPEIVLAALSTVTHRIKLASGVTVLSSADPVKVYQDFVTLDLLSKGRAEIVAGRGSFIESFPLFGYNLNDYNELFEEKLQLLLKLNSEKTITWNGQFRAPLQEQTIYPRPEQQLPIWIAVGGTPESVYRAAKLGLPIIFAIIGSMPKQFKPLVNFYKQEYIKHGHDPENMQIGVHAHTFLAESSEEILENYFPYYAAQMDRVGKSRGWSAYTKTQFQSGISKDGALFMGDPNMVSEKINMIKEMLGITRFIAHIDVGGPEHEDLIKAIKMFGSDVIPTV